MTAARYIGATAEMEALAREIALHDAMQEVHEQQRDEAFAKLTKLLDATVGYDNPVTVIAFELQPPLVLPIGPDATTELHGPIQFGRYSTLRGEGTDPNKLAQELKAKLKPAQYKKYVTEEKTTLYHINQAAVRAAATEQPVVKAAIAAAHFPGTPGLTRIFPAPATAENVLAAQLAMDIKPSQELVNAMEKRIA